MVSIFERLGGDEIVKKAVYIFYQKIVNDDELKHFFANMDMEKQANKQHAFLKYAFGGTSKYSFRDLRTAHKHLNLKEKHFNLVAGHLKATLVDLGVDEELQNEVMNLVSTTKSEVLNLS